ncbi:MAG: methyl-accepting chemotaxis protein [Anaeromicrobium sp.]|jgi:methyl-accepting chemotaxis protein|uniref:methyl-accepting chemotaxis protein n=1 Tax=Anaeromicrobium sp. TaxID=1929132 RepID=UPI0025D81739|nr:methyl-accepting chemotaxis protein [Anaeromicrobium sp.]MCT4595869.1 methyl-accepting chemotaxis protein [Anaeromicrobium sp.]
MKKNLITGSVSLLYLTIITIINMSILQNMNYYISVVINILLTTVYGYILFANIHKGKMNELEYILDIVTKSRYDYDLDEYVKNNNCEGYVSLIVDKFNNTKEASKHVLKSSVDLAQVSDKVSDKVNHMESSTEQIATTSEEIVAGSLNQMESINSIFSNIENVGHNIENIRGQLNKIMNQADVSVKLTEDGNKYVGKTKESIEIIRNDMIEYSNNLNNFIDSFSQIIKFSDIIKGITEQTNLLALNSSIEAARAGEHGKGFAVVANEIGNLSNQSQAASQEISAVIQDMEKRILELTKEMEKGTDKIQEGIHIAEKTEIAFKKISDSTLDTKSQVSTIGDHMEEMAGHTTRVINSVETIRGISEGNVADCQQFSAVIEEINTSFKDIVMESNNLKTYANSLQQSVAKDTMDKYMYQKALDVKSHMDKSNNVDLKELAMTLNIGEIYVVDNSGIIIKSSDPDGIGLDSFEIDPISYEASKLKDGYRSTPIRKRVHDNEIYKFLHIPYKEGMVISVSLSLQAVLNV